MAKKNTEITKESVFEPFVFLVGYSESDWACGYSLT
jgi:hypothetical protein